MAMAVSAVDLGRSDVTHLTHRQFMVISLDSAGFSITVLSSSWPRFGLVGEGRPVPWLAAACSSVLGVDAGANHGSKDD
jgi:hypothetical protein